MCMGVEQSVYFSRRNALTFNDPPNNIYTAISGGRMLVLKGEAVSDLDNQALEPQTAIGINRNGRYLYLVVVDARQPFYSDGATFAKLADLMIRQGVYVAMGLHGGGSSTMVIEGEDG